jgi:hypothetical protein
MTTTCMRDSIIGDAWIYEMCMANPPKKVIDPNTGQWNGNITTGPVRASFTDSVWEKQHTMKNNPASPMKHQATFLFTPWSDLTVFREEFARICQAEFSTHWNGQSYAGIDDPIRNQGEKAHKFSGYTPGLFFINPSSEYKPAVTDVRGNPVVDHAKLYPGVWVIGAVNSYASGKNVTGGKKGPRFGLQAIMIIADDKSLGGSAPDPKTLFQGVNVKPPATAIPAGFGTAPPQLPPAPIGAGALNQPSLPPAPSYAQPAPLVGGMTLEQRRAFGLP